jgi:GTP diphosphokinase / guanosine-3',5'-bis(diphosphate) 3'-diphosphatase
VSKTTHETIMAEIAAALSARGELDQGELERAYAFAARAHAGQKRKSGEPYINHPLQVALELARWGLDAPTVEAALLHDVIEDTEIGPDELELEFPAPVPSLVEGVTKLGEIDLDRGSAYAENLRKMMLAMAKDIRVLLIKLADRLHNMRTLAPLAAEDRERIAQETLDVYAPLASRLGMGEVKAELEDLAFRYLEPERFARIEQDVALVLKRRRRYVSLMRRKISDVLLAAGIGAEVAGRAKHLYSIAKKLEKQGELDKIYDLVAIRIIVPTVADCYTSLGLIHEHWKPLIYRIKDYIAVPKPNGYQSLHTTVFGEGGVIAEIQIRTQEMHELAERGVAAHFHYDELKSGKAYRSGQGAQAARQDKLAWVRSLTDWQAEIASGEEFIEGLKIDFFKDRIFVFTPKGDVYDLPEGATPVDFAFHVHTKVGETCVGAKVNGRIVPLSSKLENRDIVEILTQRGATPSQDWLSFVRTGQARSRIRAYFRSLDREKHLELGRATVEKELAKLGGERLEKLPKARVAEILDQLRQRSLEELYVGVGEGQISMGSLLRILFSPEELGTQPKKRRAPKLGTRRPGSVVVAGQRGLLVELRTCCRPLPGDRIVGVVTKREGISIHRRDCANARRAEPARLVEAHWSGSDRVESRLFVEVEDRVGMLKDLAQTVSEQGVNIRAIESHQRPETVEVELVVEVEGVEELRELIQRLERLSGVLTVKRT